jgi:very-short-patch-repair endonuclease
MGYLHNKIALIDRRKQLRNNGTGAEAVLWKYLQRSQLEGRKFRRQHSIANYIVDFYCPEEDLVVELDGAPHFTLAGSVSDAERDANLKELGITVLRFENYLAINFVEAVLDEIKKHFNNSNNLNI